MADTNGNTPFAHTDKKSGDIIRSEDWNSAMNEVVRLNNAKVNRQGADTIQGPLTIEAALTLNDRVGIGGAPATGTNAERLKVTGNAAIAGSLTIQQNQSAVLELRAIDGAHGRHAYLVSRPNSFNAYSTDLGFKVRREAAWTSEALPDAMTIAYTGNVGIGIDTPTEKLDIKGGKLQLEGNQQILFKDGDTSNNLKLQLWSGYGLGINNSTLFYAANGIHSWRDDKGTNERMKLTTAANGGLIVLGTGKSSFAGEMEIDGTVKSKSGFVFPDNSFQSTATKFCMGRESTNQIELNKPFSKVISFPADIEFLRAPNVFCSLSCIDSLKERNLRIRADAESITKTGFTLKISTWADTLIYMSIASWMAIGS